MSLTVTLLGTGGSSGVPMIGGTDGQGEWGQCDPREPRNRRTRSSIVIAGPQGRLLVDTGPDMRAQLLANQVPGIDAIVYTHAHADHILGLDDVRALNRIAGRPLEAFATADTLARIERVFEYGFRPWEPPNFFRPVLLPRQVQPGDTITAAGLSVRVFDQDHGFIRSLGLRVGGFGYSTDVVTLDDAALTMLEGVDTWVVGCFQRFAPHKTHAWIDRVREWADRVRPRRIVLTHMGVDMDWAWLRAHLPTGIEPGFDGMVLTVET